MRKYLHMIALAGSAMMITHTVNAQGYVLSQAGLGTTDMIMMSQSNSAFGTARSTAMGGAFTSLGADLYSISLNPAGLGMYTSSEFGITPSLTFGKVENSVPGVGKMDGGNRTRFALNNVGFAWNLYQGSRALTSFTLGFSYNKIADYNYKTRVAYTDNHTIGSAFAPQLNGIRSQLLQGDGNPWSNLSIPTSLWGASLAYKTYMLDVMGADDVYGVYGIGPNTVKAHDMMLRSKGSIGEYAIAGGFNFVNKIYMGFAVGLQDIYIRQSMDYYEDYDGDYTDGSGGIIPEDERMTSMGFLQDTRVSGTGVNFKFGLVYRPIDALRIGVAVHTPTFVSIDKRYQAGMGTFFLAGETQEVSANTIPATYDFDFRTPTRLMFGASYTFGTYGVISADYEHTWYSGIRVNADDNGVEDQYKDMFKNDFKGSSIFRIGGEIRPTPLLAVRAGFTHYGSFLENDDAVFEAPIANKMYNISAGVGFRLGRFTNLDVTYVFSDTKYSYYDLFNYELNNGWAYEAGIEQSQKRHNVMASLSFRF